MGILALACWLLLLPLADGIGVPHDDLIHPGERLWKENGPLEEAQVAAMQRQGEDHILLLFCECAWDGEKRLVYERVISGVYQQEGNVHIVNVVHTALLLIVLF